MTFKIFGTDGIRGKTNSYPITADLAMRLGAIIGHKLTTELPHKPRVIIGKDTRISCYMLESALSAGLLATGVDILLVGPMPTPAISFLTKSMRCDTGIMISASHNGFEDNGIKFFDRNGEKFSNLWQNEIESRLELKSEENLYCEHKKIGRATRINDVIGRYIEKIKNTFPRDYKLHNFKIVIDNANGASSKIANEIFWEVGATVTNLNDEPNGFNINHECGSLHPQGLVNKVLEEKADLGIALDGDGDRLVVVDETGKVISGNQLIAAIALYLKQTGQLKGNGIVTTIMANSSLRKFLSEFNISTHIVGVGDKMVYESMRANDIIFGGEPSGHLIFSDYAATGDGIMAALQVVGLILHSGKKASMALNLFKEMPSKSIEISHNKNLNSSNFDKIEEAVADIKNQIITDNGTIILRPSGTEKKIRLTVEMENEKKHQDYINQIESIVKRTLTEI